MTPVPLRQKPVFRALVLALVLAGTYVYGLIWQGRATAVLLGIVLDLVLLFLFFQVCAFFYAQFAVPVRRLQDRFTIWRRLLLHTRGAHGPAIFVQNGRRLERRGENRKPGPGLLWVDTASAVMTRSEAGPKQVLGPGMHFIGAGEEIAGTYSLHNQTLSMGPTQDEPAFEKPREDASEQERQRYASLQAKRMTVSGITRDGNEVVPEIHVVFRLEGKPAGPGVPGSRFGFTKEAVERAARGEGIRANSSAEQPIYVAWNQLPGLIAVDLWREYLAKFTLDELFISRFPPLPDILQPEVPVPPTAFPQTPAVVRRSLPARLLWRANNAIERWLNARQIPEEVSPDSPYSPRPATRARPDTRRSFTALQIIGNMVRARMTQAAVPVLDDCGRVMEGHMLSEEYKRLQERGLLILNVSIRGLRFDPAVEQQIIQQWNTAWLENAKNDRRHVEQLELLATQGGRQTALLEHASVLARSLRAEEPKTIAAAVKTLLQSTQNELLTDERLQGRGSDELESLSALSNWLEVSGNE